MKATLQTLTAKEALGIVSFGVLFFVSLRYAATYAHTMQTAVAEYQVLGMFLYVVILVVVIVCIPISTIPLIPIATTLWGTFLGAILTGCGWITGACIAFYIARKHTQLLERHLPTVVSLARMLDRVLSHKSVFRPLVLRTLFPVGVGSYIFGLGRALTWKKFVFVSLAEMLIMLTLLASLTTLPPLYQMVSIVALVALLLRALPYLHTLITTAVTQQNGK